MKAPPRPAPTETHDYYRRYIDRVPDGDIAETLARQLEGTRALLAGVAEARAGFRYAPAKWSLKEVVGHVIDTERVFAFRTLHFARGDQNPLPSFEQDDWVKTAGADDRTLQSLVDELVAVRGATLALVRTLDDASRKRTGIASGRTFTARSVPWIIAGHELHHRGVLSERYLPALR